MTKLQYLKQEARALKAEAKQDGISCIIILVDDARNHSVNRSIFDRHAPVVYSLLDEIKGAAIFGAVRGDFTKEENGEDR